MKCIHHRGKKQMGTGRWELELHFPACSGPTLLFWEDIATIPVSSLKTARIPKRTKKIITSPPPASPKLTPVSVGIKAGTCPSRSPEVSNCCAGPSFPPRLVLQAERTTRLLLANHVPCTTRILKPCPIPGHSPLFVAHLPTLTGMSPKNRGKTNTKRHPLRSQVTATLQVCRRTCNNSSSCPGDTDSHTCV